MRTLRLDSVGGASGDMLLGTLIDLGADIHAVRAALKALPIESFTLDAEPAASHGQHGTRVTVGAPESGGHVHRHLPDIRALLDAAELPDRARALSEAVFERLAFAEGAVHATDPETVHFHEVGALDALIDIVGNCLCLELLRIDAVVCGPLPVGRGTIRAAHGTLPIPVPAVVELLKGFPIIQTDEQTELVTPTGAALLTTWSHRLAPTGGAAPSIIAAAGTGFGHRHLAARPNLMRATLLETAATDTTPDDASCLAIECNLDDTVPELLGSLFPRLLNAGALDVYTTPIQMKKQRPGCLLTVLCRATEREAVVRLLFEETTTFGVREQVMTRTTLARRFETVATPYGPVRIKIGTFMGRDITFAPEHTDCTRNAAVHAIPLRRAYEAALDARRTLPSREPPAV